MSSIREIPNVELSDGVQIAQMGFGTGTAWFKPDGSTGIDQETVAMVKEAIKAGYRHIDTAEDYGTEAEVGLAIRESGMPREEFFVTTKIGVTVAKGTPDDLPKAIDKSLEQLQMGYVDLYLLHSPCLADGTYVKDDVAREWKHMEAIYRAGKAKAIGISNFRRYQVEALLETAEVKPVVNQIEFHPYVGGAPAYAAWLQAHGIAVVSYRGLAPIVQFAGNQLDGTLKELAAKYNVQESAVLIRWQLDQGVIVLDTTTKAERLQEYLQAVDLKMDDDDNAQITSVGQRKHFLVKSPPVYSGGDSGPYMSG